MQQIKQAVKQAIQFLQKYYAETILIIGLTILLLIFATGWFQINEMMMYFGGYDRLKSSPWIQEPINLNALYSFELFWMMTLLSLPAIIYLLVWYFTRKHRKAFLGIPQ